MRSSIISRRGVLKGALTMGGAMVTIGRTAAISVAASPYRPFSDVSEWTRSLPADAPVDAASALMISSLATGVGSLGR